MVTKSYTREIFLITSLFGYLSIDLYIYMMLHKFNICHFFMLHNVTTLLLKLLQMHILQHFPNSYDPDLHLLAGGPQSHKVRVRCFVNGVKFVTSK